MKQVFAHLIVLWPITAAICLAVVWDMGYPAGSAESLAALGAGSLVSVLMSVLFRASNRLPTFVAIVTLSVLADIFFVSGKLPSMTAMLVGAGVAFALRNVDTRWFVGVFAALFLVGVASQHSYDVYRASNVASIPKADSKTVDQTKSGPIIHIVMDELGAFESIPEALRQQKDIDELRAAYLQRGFTLFSDTRSRSAETQLSLSLLLDTRPNAQLGGNVHKIDNGFQYSVLRNRVYEVLLATHWKVKLFQSNFLDMCTEKAFECRTYDRGDHNHVFSRSQLPLLERFSILSFELHRQLSSKDRGAALYTIVTDAIKYVSVSTPPIKSSYASRPPAMVLLLDDATVRAAAAGNQDALLFHVLLPHFPWVLDRFCQIKPIDQWQVANWVDGMKRPDNLVFAAYWEQAMCAHRKLLNLIDEVEARHQNATIIIHGDHGPRILMRRLTIASPQSKDSVVQDNVLGAFLAIRAPKGIPDSIAIDASIQDRVRATLLQAGD